MHTACGGGVVSNRNRVGGKKQDGHAMSLAGKREKPRITCLRLASDVVLVAKSMDGIHWFDGCGEDASDELRTNEHLVSARVRLVGDLAGGAEHCWIHGKSGRKREFCFRMPHGSDTQVCKVGSYSECAMGPNGETSEDSAGDGLADILVELEHRNDFERADRQNCKLERSNCSVSAQSAKTARNSTRGGDDCTPQATGGLRNATAGEEPLRE